MIFKKNNMKSKSLLFWVYLAVNLYLISMLVFVSVQFFGGSDIGKISAFGSVLGGVGAFFAGFVAIYLFNGWKVQHNHTSLKEFSLKVFYVYTDINIRLVSITDIFVKSLKKHKIGPSKHILSKVADDIEPELKIIGDRFVELIHQIHFFQKLNSDSDNQTLTEMHNLILEYAAIMDISYYRQLTDHEDFANAESELKVKWDGLGDPFCDYLKKYIVFEKDIRVIK